MGWIRSALTSERAPPAAPVPEAVDGLRRLELHRVPPCDRLRAPFLRHEPRARARRRRAQRPVAWSREFGRCIAASPALGSGVVYVSLMGPAPCTHPIGTLRGSGRPQARTGRILWRFRAGRDRVLAVARRPASSTSAPGTIASTRWTFARTGLVGRSRLATRSKAVCLRARHRLRGLYDGHVYALDARTRAACVGRPARSAGCAGAAGSMRRPPSPTAASSSARPTGSCTPSVRGAGTCSGPGEPGATSTGRRGRPPDGVLGSYDHRFYALDAATGGCAGASTRPSDLRAPTVLDGLVYFSTCGSCSAYEADARARRTYALDARTGRPVWTFPDGEYSPLVADSRRAYLPA